MKYLQPCTYMWGCRWKHARIKSKSVWSLAGLWGERRCIVIQGLARGEQSTQGSLEGRSGEQRRVFFSDHRYSTQKRPFLWSPATPVLFKTEGHRNGPLIPNTAQLIKTAARRLDVGASRTFLMREKKNVHTAVSALFQALRRDQCHWYVWLAVPSPSSTSPHHPTP